MSTPSPIVGHTMAFTTITDALRLIHKLDGRAIQVSLGDMTSRQVQRITDEDAATARRIIAKGYYVVIHGKFIYNFCRPVSSIGWQHKVLCDELAEAGKIGADVIIHQGKNLPELKQTKQQAHQTFADNIVTVLDMCSGLSPVGRIILENSSRQGTECGYSLSDIVDIYEKIPEKYHPRIGFCIDLCHIFVAGELDVRDANAVKDWFNRFDELIGLDRLFCIHFNDSNTDFNGANDNHGSIGRGYIGQKSIQGFKYVCKLAHERGIPLVLETSSEHLESEIRLLRGWCAT